MANRVPLIINTTANQIQELALGDCLDLTASGIHNAGVITATKFVGDGSLLTNVTGGGGTSGISDIVEDTTPQLGGNLDINGNIINGSGSIVITGGIQASSFTGPLIGNVTGNVTGNADTATTATTATTANTAGGLTGSPSIQVSSVIVSGNILADTVSVASTLTYEDVTNVDSVGIVTARSGIKVLSNGIDAVGVVTATSFDGSIAASNLTGDLPAISGANLTNLPSDVLNDTTPQLGGNLDLNSKDITGTGNIEIGGNLDVAGVSTFGRSASGNNVAEFFTSNSTGQLSFGRALGAGLNTTSYLKWSEPGAQGTGEIRFGTSPASNNPTERLRITSGGKIGINETSPQKLLHITASNDDSSIRLENTADTPNNVWEISPSISGVSNTGFTIRDVTDSRNALVIDGSGDTTFAGDINLSEGKKTIFGSNSGSGAYIKHQSGHLEIKNETGNLYWDNTGLIRIRTGASYTEALSITGNQDVQIPNGYLQIDPTDHDKLKLKVPSGSSDDWAYMTFWGEDGTRNAYFGTNAAGDIKISRDGGCNLEMGDNAVFNANVSDSKGELRTIPFGHSSAQYTLAKADVGKAIEIDNGAIINAGVFAAGDIITLINGTGSDMTITAGTSPTMVVRNSNDGGSTGDRTLGARGMCTVYFKNQNNAYISGAGLS